MQPSPLTVLVCPLDWGLGHASRMIPVIHRLIKDGHKVILAGSGRSAELLKTTFPDLPFLILSSPAIRFGEGISYLWFLLQVPSLIFSVFREHKLVKLLVHSHHIDVIISDNRYGLFCQSAYTVFVTHQVSPVLPAIFRPLEYPLYRVIRRIIKLFDECWIPDFEDGRDNLSGKLSHRFALPANAKFIGLLSRFNNLETPVYNNAGNRYNLAVVLSGPEPQISLFEDLVYRQLQNSSLTAVLFRGMRETLIQNPEPTLNLTWISHMQMHEFADTLRQSERVICRSGYSGIMDMVVLGIQAILVPTPGQSEQEYLGTWLASKGWFRVVAQDDLVLPGVLMERSNQTIPDFNQNPLQASQGYFEDLYRKYSCNRKKPDQES